MNGPSGNWRLIAIANPVVLTIAFVSLFAHGHPSGQYLLGIILGAVAIAGVAAATFADAFPLRAAARTTPVLRSLVGVAPWIAGACVVARSGLWWTQRPEQLRFLAMWVALNWTVVWSLPESHARFAGGPARALAWLAALLGAAAIEGAAFGVSPFGCAVCFVMGTVGAIAWAVASLGTRTLCLKTFAACSAAIVAVAGVELGVRAAGIGHNVQESDSRQVAREFYTLTPPHAAFVNEPKPLDEFGPALISINALGTRGPELKDARADVLLIGDSMVEARQLPWEQSVGPQLQDVLNQRHVPLRVVAHGMRGWSTLLEWNWYLKVGRTLHPRVVMLFYFWNDLWTAGTEAATFNAKLDADGRPEYFDVPIDPWWIWYKHLRVVRLAADVVQRLSVAELRRAFTAATHDPTGRRLDDAAADKLARSLTDRPLAPAQLHDVLTRPLPDLPPDLRRLATGSLWPSMRPLDLWTNTQRAAAAVAEREMAHFAEDVAADGGKLVIVYVPNPLQVGANECSVGRLFDRVDTGVLLPPDSGIQTWLAGVAERHAIPLLDASADMREAEQHGTGSPFYLRADCHWSERGHAFMAEYLADWLRHNDAKIVGALTR